MLNHRTCGECAIWQHSGGNCPYFNEPVEKNATGCLKFTSSIVKCELCGGITVPQASYIDMTNPEQEHIVCAGCQQHFGHCPTCKHTKNCSFETDPSSLPKVIQQQTRQGNMISVTQVKNPARIDITCKKGCPCFSEEFGCLRQFNSCGSYKIVYED
jgi:hypothetical protein